MKVTEPGLHSLRKVQTRPEFQFCKLNVTHVCLWGLQTESKYLWVLPQYPGRRAPLLTAISRFAKLALSAQGISKKEISLPVRFVSAL